jgi:hypothetical protein
MSWIFSLYVAFLFFILTPAILVRLPPKAGKFTVAGFHAVVFALVLHFTGKMVWNLCRSLEGFQEGVAVNESVFKSKCSSRLMNGTFDSSNNAHFYCSNPRDTGAVNAQCVGSGFTIVRDGSKIIGCKGSKV